MLSRRSLMQNSLAFAVLVATFLGRAPASRAKGLFNPRPLVIDETLERVFACDAMNSVSEIDARTGRVMRTLMLGAAPLYPRTLALDAHTHRLYVGSDRQTTGRLSVIDARNGRLLYSLPAPAPGSIVLAARVQRAYILDGGDDGTGRSGEVLLVDTSRGVVLRTLWFTAFPRAGAVDDEVGHVFISDPCCVFMLDAATGRLLRVLPAIANTPSALAVDPRRHRVFVTNGDQVQVLDSRSGALLASGTLGRHIITSALAVDSGTGHLVATSYDETDLRGIVSLLDATTGSVLYQVKVGRFLTAVTVMPALGRIVVLNDGYNNNVVQGDGSLHILQESSGRVLFAHDVSGMAMVVSARTGYAFILDADNQLTVIDLHTNARIWG